MNRNRLKALSAVWLVMGIVPGTVQAEDRKYRDEVSGTAAPTPFDANSDGVTASAATFAGRSNRGPIHGGLIAEFDFRALAPHDSCPAGTLKLPVVLATGNRALTGDDGQMFMRDNPGRGTLLPQ